MMFPLLEYVDSVIIKSHGTYDSSAVAASRLELLRPTNMVDYATDIYKGLHGADAVPADLEERRRAVFETLGSLTAKTQTLVDLAKDEGRRKALREDGKWNVQGLATVDIPEDIVESYRSLAKFNYECGNYKAAREMLDVYLSLFVDSRSSTLSPSPDVASSSGAAAAGTPQSQPCYGLPSPLPAALHAARWGKRASLLGPRGALGRGD